MSIEHQSWIRQFFFLALFAIAIHLLQAVGSFALWMRVSSPVLLVFGCDAVVNVYRQSVFAMSVGLYKKTESFKHPRKKLLRIAAVGYVLVGLIALGVAVGNIWGAQRPYPTLLGVGLAAISILIIPVIGSYMKVLAIEIKNPVLRDESVFTFGNSYLSMVLLISLLINSGMDIWWGDLLGAIVMAPFILQKGIQGLIDSPMTVPTKNENDLSN